jgi:hypothetical protein
LFGHGALAGIIGGLVIAATGMGLSAVRGAGFWSLPNGIGGILSGPAAGATRDLGVITLTGVLLHMALSAIFGVVTLFAIRRVTREYLGTGIVFGLALWLFNYYFIGLFVPGAHALAELNPVWIGGGLHLLFGAVCGIAAKRLDEPAQQATSAAAGH